MKLWPEELAKKYPLPPGVVRERPWWRRELAEDSRLQWERFKQEQAGSLIQTGFTGLVYQLTRTDGVALKGERLAQFAEIDKADPLPHPGFRVGQVWALLRDRVASSVDASGKDHPAESGFEVVEISGYEWTFPPGMGPWYLSTRYDPLSDTDLCSLLEEAYLIADPCCPWLAPWAPVEKLPRP